jgi:hypothetical protein
VIHDDVKAWIRDYQRITKSADKSVNTDEAYDAALARNKAWAEEELAAEKRSADIDTATLPLLNMRVRQAQ